jgi:hypothetical protein
MSHQGKIMNKTVTLREASAQVRSLTGNSKRFVHAQTFPATQEDARPRLDVYYVPELGRGWGGREGPGVSLTIRLTDTLKEGNATAILDRDGALLLIKAMVQTLEIAPHELADL